MLLHDRYILLVLLSSPVSRFHFTSHALRFSLDSPLLNVSTVHRHDLSICALRT